MISNRKIAIIIPLLTFSVVLIYWQVLHFDFIIYDDPNYVVDNIYVRNGFTWKGVIWAFTTTNSANWHPLTWLSLMMDGQLYGLNAGGYHWTNVMFHLANTLLLFLVLNRMTGALWRSGFVAALFGVHPLHVESVAWVAERKDVLSAFFWMLTMGAYVHYVERLSFVRYLAVVLLFVLGLMSKPMLVTLPFILLLLDFWPLRRFTASFSPEGGTGSPDLYHPILSDHGGLVRSGWRWLLLEKVPLIILAVLSGVITIYAQKAGGAIIALDRISMTDRMANALVSYVMYLYKMIWPDKLALLYPYPHAFPLHFILLAAFLIGLFTIIALKAPARFAYVKTGWLWYLGTLVPVIGIIQVGNQAMADRYTYIPMIGVFILIAWVIPHLLKGMRLRRTFLTVSAISILMILVFASYRQTSLWANSETILLNSIENTAGNYEACNNLGVVHFQKGEYDQSINYLEKSIKINPGYAAAYNNLGQAYAVKGDLDRAIILFREGLHLQPGLRRMQKNLAVALLHKGELQEALPLYRELIIQNPGDADLRNDLGVILARMGEKKEAQLHFEKAILLKPNHEAARHNLNNLFSHTYTITNEKR